jgi:hypothetical protein
MKKFILLSLATICVGIAQAQEKKKIIIKIGDEDGTHISAGNRVLVHQSKDNKTCNKKKRKYPMIKKTSFDMGWNSALDKTNYSQVTTEKLEPKVPYIGIPGQASGMKLNTYRSRYFNISPRMYGIPLYKKNLNLTTGIGFSFYNYSFVNDLSLGQDSLGQEKLVFGLHGNEIKKNKIATSYVNIPLSLQAKIGHGKHKFVIGGGASVGYRLKTWQKALEEDGSRSKNRISNTQEPLLVNAIGEIGIHKKIRFFGTYGLNNIAWGKLNYQPISVGVRLSGI